MTAIWVLLGVAVLFGAGILGFVLYTVRSERTADESESPTPPESEP